MKETTIKCVQCGECMVPESDKPGAGRTGCVLFHDQRYARKHAPQGKQGEAQGKSRLDRLRRWIGKL